MKKILFYAAFIASIFALNSFKTIEKNIFQDKEIQNFSLRNVNGQFIGLNDYPNAKGFVVIFTCNHCPFAKLYSERLNFIDAKYKPLGIPLLAINAMDSVVYEEETFDLMRERAKTEKFTFPYLQDAAQIVGKDFQAEHTPQAYIIWKEKNNTFHIKYAGAIDDNGQVPEKATPYIPNALDELLQGKSVTHSKTKSVGCAIYYRK